MESKINIDSLVGEFLQSFQIADEEASIHKMCLRKALEQVSNKHRNDEEKRLREFLEEQKETWLRQFKQVTTDNPANTSEKSSLHNTYYQALLVFRKTEKFKAIFALS